jgi:DNA-binding MarR family transcriptional regulator
LELISRAHLTWKRRVARDVQSYGVTPKQIYVLGRLAASSGLTPSRIAELIFADRPTATSMLNTLERAGWITRRRDPDNRRQVIVEISPRGRATLASVPERLWRSGKTTLDPAAGLSAAERAELTRLLEKLNASIDEVCAARERRASKELA